MSEMKMNEDGWINHQAGNSCPIPWARGGEFEYRYNSNKKNFVAEFDASLYEKCLWGDDLDWRLINDWIPILNGKMPEQLRGILEDNWIYRERDGSEKIAGGRPDEYTFVPTGTDWDIVAVRVITKSKAKRDISSEVAVRRADPIKPTFVKEYKHQNWTPQQKDSFSPPPGIYAGTELESIDAFIFENYLVCPARSSDAYLRFRNSPRGKEALAQIGKAEGPAFKSLGEDIINDIAAAALEAHDKVWPRRKK